MATIVDAFVLQLGLDASKFTKEQRAALDALKKTRDGAVGHAKAIENASQKAADSIDRISRSALTLFAVFTGARGIEDFVKNITASNAALGRLAYNLDMAPQALSGWEMAARRFGGSNEATAQTIEGVSKALFDFRNGAKQFPVEMSRLEAMTGTTIDRWHGSGEFLSTTAEALKKMAAIDPGKAHQFARAIGIDDATAALMERYGKAVTAYVGVLGHTLGPTQDMVENSQRLVASWNGLSDVVIKLGNVIQNSLTPYLAPLLDEMGDWLQNQQPAIEAAVKDFGKGIASVDWKGVGSDISSFAHGANDAVQMVGGWKDASEVLFAMWAGPAFAKALVNAGALAKSGAGVIAGVAAIQTLAELAKQNHVLQAPSKDKGAMGNFLWFLDPGLAKRMGYGNSASKDDGLNVDGTPVSKANPMPVTAVGGQQEETGRGIGGSTGNGLETGGGGGGATPSGGGGGGTGSDTLGPRTAINMSVPPEGRALLDVLASGEAKDYNVLNGGGTFSDYSRHPGGRAAGRYQDLPSTWAGIQRETGIHDFSPASQDKGNWYLAQRDYKRNTGRDLLAELKSGDPGRIAAVGNALRGTWISLNSNFGKKYKRAIDRVTKPDAKSQGWWSGSGNTPTGGASGTTPHPALMSPSLVNQHSSSNEVHIGALHVHTHATDGAGVARTIAGELRKTLAADHSNYGLA